MTPRPDYDPHAVHPWRGRFNAAGVSLLGLFLAVTNPVAAAWRKVNAGCSYAANALACCAACHERFQGLLRHPLTTAAVLLIGLSANTAVSVHYAKKGTQQATEINAQSLVRAKKLYLLRQYTDDGIKTIDAENRTIDAILRSYAPEHPGVVLPPPLPPPLPPEPNYDIDDVMPATQPATRP